MTTTKMTTKTCFSYFTEAVQTKLSHGQMLKSQSELYVLPTQEESYLSHMSCVSAVAEAKASAAAEELLAEEKEEKTQAAASTMAGKAKPGKGKNR